MNKTKQKKVIIKNLNSYIVISLTLKVYFLYTNIGTILLNSTPLFKVKFI